MTAYAYVVAQDYGFAPNPFHGACTLATCKPRIRKRAQVGDYIFGGGSAAHGRSGHLVFFMRVSEVTTFCEYWKDARFQCKRPNLHGSKMQAYGDNIYHRDRKSGDWLQADSYHSRRGGRPNRDNVDHDTQTANVLIASEFAYWGGEGPRIPDRCRYDGTTDLFWGRGYRIIPDKIATQLLAWVRSLKSHQGCLRDPQDWARARSG